MLYLNCETNSQNRVEYIKLDTNKMQQYNVHNGYTYHSTNNRKYPCIMIYSMSNSLTGAYIHNTNTNTASISRLAYLYHVIERFWKDKTISIMCNSNKMFSSKDNRDVVTHRIHYKSCNNNKKFQDIQLNDVYITQLKNDIDNLMNQPDNKTQLDNMISGVLKQPDPSKDSDKNIYIATNDEERINRLSDIYLSIIDTHDPMNKHVTTSWQKVTKNYKSKFKAIDEYVKKHAVNISNTKNAILKDNLFKQHIDQHNAAYHTHIKNLIHHKKEINRLVNIAINDINQQSTSSIIVNNSDSNNNTYNAAIVTNQQNAGRLLKVGIGGTVGFAMIAGGIQYLNNNNVQPESDDEMIDKINHDNEKSNNESIKILEEVIDDMEDMQTQINSTDSPDIQEEDNNNESSIPEESE